MIMCVVQNAWKKWKEDIISHLHATDWIAIKKWNIKCPLWVLKTECKCQEASDQARPAQLLRHPGCVGLERPTRRNRLLAINKCFQEPAGQALDELCLHRSTIDKTVNATWALYDWSTEQSCIRPQVSGVAFYNLTHSQTAKFWVFFQENGL